MCVVCITSWVVEREDNGAWFLVVVGGIQSRLLVLSL